MSRQDSALKKWKLYFTETKKSRNPNGTQNPRKKTETKYRVNKKVKK